MPNRGHNSIASFSVDPQTGALTAVDRASTEAVPSAFSLDPQGRFVFGAGSATAASPLTASRGQDDAPGDLRRRRSPHVGADDDAG